jgi:voltage-gated potassium channel
MLEQMIKTQLVERISKTRSTLAAWQFGQLAVFFFALLFVLPLLKHGLLVKSVTTLFVLNSLLVADSNSPNARWLRWAAWTLWLIATVSNVVEEFHLDDALTFVTKCVAIGSHIALFVICAVAILAVVFRAGRVTLDGILASVVAYQLIGLIFAQIYTLAMLVNPNSLHLPDNVEPSTDNFQLEMIYFSFVTLATLGYGDVLPDTNFTRSVSIVEAILGQFYVAVIVAVLVSAFIAQRMEDQARR